LLKKEKNSIFEFPSKIGQDSESNWHWKPGKANQ